MGWAAKELAVWHDGRAGQHPQDCNVEKVSAVRALRPGAASLQESDAHPIAECNDTDATGTAQPWPDLRI